MCLPAIAHGLGVLEPQAQLAAEKRRADEAQTELQQLDARAKEKERPRAVSRAENESAASGEVFYPESPSDP